MSDNSRVNAYRNQYNAINIIYKSLQKDRDKADISDIIKQLHEVIDDAIKVHPDRGKEPSKPYDISKIDFNRLRAEFENTKAKIPLFRVLKMLLKKIGAFNSKKSIKDRFSTAL